MGDRHRIDPRNCGGGGVLHSQVVHADSNPAGTGQQVVTNRDSLKTAQDKSRTDYQNAKDANSAAQNVLTTAQKNNSAAQEKVTSASQAASAAQDSQAAAQKTADQAQSEFNQISDAAKQANNPAAVSDANQQVTNAQQSAASAAGVTSDAQKGVDAAQEAVSDAQKMVDGAQSTVDQKTQAVSDAQTNVDKAQTALNNAQKGAGEIPMTTTQQIIMPDNWVNVIKTTIGQDSIIQHDPRVTPNANGDNPQWQELIDLYKDTYKTQNAYQNNEALSKIPVEFNSDGTLSAKDQLLVTRYVANLLNPLRAKLGTPLIQVTQRSLDLATKVAHDYGVENWTIDHGHDLAILNRDGSEAENVSIVSPDKPADLNDLLMQTYLGILLMTVEDQPSNWGHAIANLATGSNAKTDYGVYVDYTNLPVYLGVQWDKNNNMHMEFFRDKGPSHPDTTKHYSLDYNADATSSTDTSAEQAALTKAQDALKQAQAEQTTAQNNLTAAQGALTQPNTTLANKQQALKDAQAKQAAADQTVKDAQAKVDAMTNAKDALAKAQTKLDDAKQALADANTKLAAAQDTLAKAQAAAKTAEATLKDAQTKADAAASDLQKAKDALITDAKVYGDSVQIKPITDQPVNSSVPNLEIANPMVKDPTQSAVMDTFLQLAMSELDPVPTGTTVAFANPDAVKAMMTTTGVKTADVLITFPDHSTVTKQVKFNVVAAPVENPSGSEGTDSQAPSTSEETGSQAPSDSQGASSQVPSDSQGATSQASSDTEGTTQLPSDADQTNTKAPAATVADTTETVVMPSATKNNVTNGSLVATATQVAQPKAKQSVQVLPQTGNDQPVGAVALGLAGLLSMFGMLATQRKHN